MAMVAQYTGGGDKLQQGYCFDLLSPDHSAAHVRSVIERFEGMPAAPAVIDLPEGLGALQPLDEPGAGGSALVGPTLRFEPWGVCFAALA